MSIITLKTQPLNIYVKLSAALFSAILIIWSFDTAAFWKTQKQAQICLGRGIESPAEAHIVVAPASSSKPILQPESIQNSTPRYEKEVQEVFKRSGVRIPGFYESRLSEVLEWIRFPEQEGLTETVLRRLAENGSRPCHALETARVDLVGFSAGEPLTAGIIHRFVLKSYDKDGNPRCSGGDYFESDLSGVAWKSRPPVTDLGNGSYILSLQVDPRFAGLFRLTVILLFGNFNGLHLRPDRWARKDEVLNLDILFTPPKDSTPRPRGRGLPLRGCSRPNYGRNAWSGRWTRGNHDDTCNVDSRGRFRCLDRKEPCESPWCEGYLGALESNGWVYSAHCSFRILSADEAWRCLDGKWLFFWGDSNHVDTIRNLLNFVLGLWEVKSVPRRFDRWFSGPGSRRVRITNVFNGHWNETMNYQGLYSLTDPGFREMLWSFFRGETVPDFMIMNSGLHDGVYWKNTRLFAGGAEMAAEFWGSVMDAVEKRGKRRPVFLYRTTIATGGYARALWYNPYKMETYNHILLEKLRKRNLVDMVVDDFDMTYPWHYDNNCSDGVHYGRAPAKARWHGQIGHQYFVDLMLVHVLLNAICFS